MQENYENPSKTLRIFMKPKRTNHQQGRLFEARLSDQLDPKHELLLFSKLIDWNALESEVAGYFDQQKGAPAKPTRLITGLLILQQMYGISDEQVVLQWKENPYWQLFCGFDYLQWELPIDPSSLVRWRKRLGEEGLKKIFASTILWARKGDVVSKSSLQQVVVDTTVMPKNIAYPTDAKLYFNGIQALRKFALTYSLPLRQSYRFLAKKHLALVGKYTHARQPKRARKHRNKLKTYLGRLRRDVGRILERKPSLKPFISSTLEVIDRILRQKRDDKKKIYSIHEPNVDCIAKGKVHKKYEFGCKTSIVVTHKEGLVVGMKAFHGNPYDGHTLQTALQDAEDMTQQNIKRVAVDKGYRGHRITNIPVFISGKKGLTRHFKGWLKRRESIEPHIGHMKSDGKLGRNYLKGKLGDTLNALLCGIGHNVRMILRSLRMRTFSCPCL